MAESLTPFGSTLTRKAAERLLWREEWRRHRVFLSHGLALWIWLFLIPGSTTQLETLMPWSILWAGLVAARIGGYDLLRGIEPLVRTLPPSTRMRWHLRAAMVVALAALFYVAGRLACEGRLASQLWGLIADSPLASKGDAGRAGFTAWQGLTVTVLVAMVGYVVASTFHGLASGVFYAFALIAAAYVTAGDEPVMTVFLADTETLGTAYQGLNGAATIIGDVAVPLTALAWSVGAWHFCRRPPIASPGRKPGLRWQWLPFAIGAFAAGSVWLSWGHVMHGLKGEAGPMDAGRWTVALVIAEMAMFVAWVLTVKPWADRSRRDSLAPLSRPAKATLSLLIALCLGQLALLGWQMVAASTVKVAGVWPASLTDVRVATTQSWVEAESDPIHAEPPAAYDMVAWLSYHGWPASPLAVTSGTLPIPAPGGSIQREFPLEVPPFFAMALGSQWYLRLELQWTEIQSSRADARGRSILHLKWAVTTTPADTKPYYRSGVVLDSANDRVRYLPVLKWLDHNIQSARAPYLPVSVVLIPQRSGAVPKGRPWGEVIPPNLRDRDSLGAGWTDHSYTSAADFINRLLSRDLPLLLVPVGILLALLAAHCRRWALAQVGLVGAVFLGLIGVDAVRMDRLEAVAIDTRLPAAQRNLARLLQDKFTFHYPPRPSVKARPGG